MTLSPQDKINRLRAIIESDPADHLGRFMLAKLLLDEKQYAEAAVQLAYVLEAKPDYSAAYRLRGDAFRLAGERGEAAAVYRKGIEVAERVGDLQTMKEMQVFLKRVESEG